MAGIRVRRCQGRRTISLCSPSARPRSSQLWSLDASIQNPYMQGKHESAKSLRVSYKSIQLNYCLRAGGGEGQWCLRTVRRVPAKLSSASCRPRFRFAIWLPDLPDRSPLSQPTCIFFTSDAVGLLRKLRPHSAVGHACI